MIESPIAEITRILAAWPEGDRLAGVLRVVRSVVAERDARVSLATAKAWCEEARSDLAMYGAETPLPASLLAALAEEKARGTAAHPEPAREERADPEPHQYTGPIGPPHPREGKPDYTAGPLSDWNALPARYKQNWRGECPACKREVIMEVESYPNPMPVSRTVEPATVKQIDPVREEK